MIVLDEKLFIANRAEFIEQEFPFEIKTTAAVEKFRCRF